MTELQSELNAAMRVPLREILTLNPEIQEAVQQSHALQQLRDILLRQASLLATGRGDEVLAKTMADEFLEIDTALPGLCEPIFGVIEDIIETYGEKDGRAIIKERAESMTSAAYDRIISAVITQKLTANQ